MDGGYKQAKEDFVSGATGSSITHINLISLVALSAVTLYAAISTRIHQSRRTGFFTSWAILVFPMLLSMTIAANYPLYLNVLLLIPTAIVLRYPMIETGTPLPSSQPASPALQTRIPSSTSTGERRLEAKQTAKLPPLPALTTYRAHMMLMTVLAILAVDFPVFPRSLVKCETFGVSLMDLGVGSFVFSQGIVSAIPLVKDVSYLQAPLLPKLIKRTKKSLPVIALGIVRVLLVKGTEYPEHVTEYGVHWNFFITLALLPVLQVFLHPLLLRLPISMIGVLIGIAQQIALTQLKLREYVLSAPRTSLVSANKEGLVSLLGYLSIQLLGLSAGTLILPPTPSFFRRRQQALAKENKNNDKRKRRDSNTPSPHATLGSSHASMGSEPGKASELDLSAPRQLDKTATELCAYAILWWSLLGLARLTRVDGRWSQGQGVSRRMVNISYILWIAAFNVTFISLYLVVLDLWILRARDESGAAASPTPSHSKHHQRRKAVTTDPNMHANTRSVWAADTDASAAPSAAYFGVSVGGASVADSRQLHKATLENPPKLLEVINRHGLAVFLLANVLTGLINLSFSTMYMSDASAMLVLSLYSLVCCAVPWVWSRWKKHGQGKMKHS